MIFFSRHHSFFSRRLPPTAATALQEQVTATHCRLAIEVPFAAPTAPTQYRVKKCDVLEDFTSAASYSVKVVDLFFQFSGITAL